MIIRKKLDKMRGEYTYNVVSVDPFTDVERTEKVFKTLKDAQAYLKTHCVPRFES